MRVEQTLHFATIHFRSLIPRNKFQPVSIRSCADRTFLLQLSMKADPMRMQEMKEDVVEGRARIEELPSNSLA